MELISRSEQEDAAAFRKRALLAALNDFYCPVEVGDLAAYVATFAPGIELTTVASLVQRECEVRRSGSSQGIWLCPALREPPVSFDDRFMTRSDWRVQNRLILSDSDDTRHLWLLRVFCDLLLVATEQSLGSIGALASRARVHAEFGHGRLFSGLVSALDSSSGMLDTDAVERLREEAEDAHAGLAGDEEAARAIVVQEYERLVKVDLTFGGIA
jgi:hypothetical protein